MNNVMIIIFFQWMDVFKHYINVKIHVNNVIMVFVSNVKMDGV